jgi:microcystin-dependent protein
MKKFLLLIAFSIYVTLLQAQSFQQSKGFAFQGYARDFNGAALGSQELFARFSIFPFGAPVEFEEEQLVETDPYGLFSATIGSVSQLEFSKIDFMRKNYWIKVETRASGGDWAIVSETELLAVPYAKSAENGIPVGTILPFGGPITNVPAGFLPCDGAEVSADDYPKLFDAIGDGWGAGTGTNFRVPDLRGQFMRGWDNGKGTDNDAGTRTALYSGGATGDNVGSYQSDGFKAHFHADFSTNSSGEVVASGTGAVVQGAENSDFYQNGGTTGGAETRPKNAYVLYIIKY